MLKNPALSAILIAFFGSLGTPAFATLSASPIVITYQGEADSRRDITLSNNGDRPQYLEINAFRIVTPGEYPEELLTDHNPEKIGLLVAPRRVTLKPGEKKIIRVIRLEKEVNEDEAWRVHIKPTEVEITALASGAMVQLGYKALIIARPKTAKENLIVNRIDKKLMIKNTGNTNIVLLEGEQCNFSGELCKSIAGKRIWPGREWQVDLPYTTPVVFETFGAGGKGEVIY